MSTGTVPRAGAAVGHPPQEILGIADNCSTAMGNMPRLDAWVRELDLPVDRALVPLMCLQAVFFAPWLPAAHCYQLSQLTMWLMALDNVLDDPGAAPERLAARIDDWRRIVEGGPAAPDDPMALALAEISTNLHRAGRSDLQAFWQDSMQETLTGMWLEREAAEAAGRGELPRLDTYLLYASWSIGVEQQLAALWALMDEPDLSRRLPVLRGALRHAAKAVRLVNDLRGHRREQAEGQVDALAIGLSEEQARRAAAESFEDCRVELAPLTATGYGPAVALERVLLWHTRMYEHFDPVRPRHDATESTDVEKPTVRRTREMTSVERILEIVAANGECDNATLEGVYDRLEPVDADFLKGTWKGGWFERGTENAGLMEQMRWYGKRFVSEEHVEPLLCTREDGTVYSFEEMGLATIRQVVFHGRQSAAMVYDQLPIVDHFRRLTDDVMLGIMDKKGEPVDFYFHLTRVPDPTDSMTRATAAVLRSADGDYTLEEVGLTEPGPGELRVRIAGTGLCHTEGMARGEMYAAVRPMVLGHEGAGVVEAVGAGVAGIRPGDHVVLSFDSCGECANCRAAHPTCCDTFTPRNLVGVRPDGSTTLRDSEGKQIAGRWFGQSSLATHAIATARNVVVVDSSLPLEKLGPLGCGVQTGAGAVLRSLRVQAGSSIVVLGVGSVGLSAVMAARVAGATRIVAVDLNDQRLSLAREFGATDTLRGDVPDLTEQIRKAAGGGVQYGLDTTGVPAVVSAGIAALRTTGTMGLVAVLNGTLEIDTLTLGTGKTLTGIVAGDSVPQDFIPELIALWQQGRFPFDRLIETYPLSKINEAERDMLAGRVIKPVLVP
ncbi:zinc-binding dehydrogenase [Streptomyces sp. CA-249302]|uniref:zinc-binding dehydrogenase n=1 Tax=Streptomyces sp. CA-249302 TaxID=3240058 RepID=UPI003D8FBF88